LQDRCHRRSRLFEKASGLSFAGCRGMTRLALAVAVAASAVMTLHGAPSKPDAHRVMTSKERAQFIHSAQVWMPTTISEMDLRAGPDGPGAFEPDQLVTCNYVERKLTGSSRKFECEIDEGDVVKVRYGA